MALKSKFAATAESPLKTFFVFTLLLFGPAAPSFASADVHGAPSWRTKGKLSLDKIVARLEENHPAFPLKDLPENRLFLETLRRESRHARRKLKKISDKRGYYFTLREFVNRFQDAHLTFSPHSVEAFKSLFDLQWPGFTVEFRSDDFRIRFWPEHPEKEGWILRGCDGRPPEDWMRQNVFPYYGTPSLKAHWILWAPRLFLSLGNPFETLPVSCTVSDGSEIHEFPLLWKKVPFEEIWPKITEASRRFSQKAAFEKIAPEVFWVSFPKMSWRKEEKIRTVVPILEGLQKLQGTPTVVFDLRGNGGGDSRWAEELLGALFSPAYVDWVDFQRSRRSRETYHYRVSGGNLTHFRKALVRMEQEFASPTPWFVDVVHGLEEKHLRKSPLFSKATTITSTQVLPRLKAKTIFLTDHACASACLDFLDLGLEIPGSEHVGLETSADSRFMDSRSILIDSELDLWLKFPMAYIENRPRGHNQPLKPARRFWGDLSDTEAVQRWLLEVLQNKETAPNLGRESRWEVPGPTKRSSQIEAR